MFKFAALSVVLLLTIYTTIYGAEESDRIHKMVSPAKRPAPAKHFRKIARVSTTTKKVPTLKIITSNQEAAEKTLDDDNSPGVGGILFQTAGDLLAERVRLFQRSGEIISKGVERLAKSGEKAKTVKPTKANDEVDEGDESMEHVERKPFWPTNAWPGIESKPRHGSMRRGPDRKKIGNLNNVNVKNNVNVDNED